MSKYKYTRMVIWLPETIGIKQMILSQLNNLGYSYGGVQGHTPINRAENEDKGYVLYTIDKKYFEDHPPLEKVIRRITTNRVEEEECAFEIKDFSLTGLEIKTEIYYDYCE